MEKKSNVWGIMSMICGITSIIICLAPYLGLPIAICAVVFDRQQRKIQANGVSTTGLVTGILGIVINGMMLFIFGIFLLIWGGLNA